MNSYQLNTEQRIKYYDEVERLAGVVVASVSLGIAEREQAKKEKLEDLTQDSGKRYKIRTNL
mgnify:CR=1 FL=1